MNILRCVTLAAFGALVSGTAFAGGPVQVLEPVSIGLFAAGAAGLFALRRFRSK